MSEQDMERFNLPEQSLMVRLLKKYGHDLFEGCPSSEHLVLYVEDRGSLADHEVIAIERHMKVCLDCKDKIRWLAEPEDKYPVISYEAVDTYSLEVHVPAHGGHINDTSLAYAAQSLPNEACEIGPVPWVESEDGCVYAEIGQDLEHRLFLYIERLPAACRGRAIQVQAITRDRVMLESPCNLLTQAKIIIAQRADVKPEDLERIVIKFFPILH